MAAVLLLSMYCAMEARQKRIFDELARAFDAKFGIVRTGSKSLDSSTSNQGDVTIFRTEAELMANRPRHFHRMMDFADVGQPQRVAPFAGPFDEEGGAEVSESLLARSGRRLRVVVGEGPASLAWGLRLEAHAQILGLGSPLYLRGWCVWV